MKKYLTYNGLTYDIYFTAYKSALILRVFMSCIVFRVIIKRESIGKDESLHNREFQLFKHVS